MMQIESVGCFYLKLNILWKLFLFLVQKGSRLALNRSALMPSSQRQGSGMMGSVRMGSSLALPGMHSVQLNGSMLLGGDKLSKNSPPGKPKKTAEVAPVQDHTVPDIKLDVSMSNGKQETDVSRSMENRKLDESRSNGKEETCVTVDVRICLRKGKLEAM